jgi:hypothetical protein
MGGLDRQVKPVLPFNADSSQNLGMERQGKSGWAILVIAVVLLPALYILSVGPAVWLHSRGAVSERVVTTAYLPLELAADRSDLVMDVIVRYIDLWDGPNGPTADLAPPMDPLLPAAIPSPYAPATPASPQPAPADQTGPGQ